MFQAAQFYSPEDQLREEQARLMRSSNPDAEAAAAAAATADTEPGSRKRPRLAYEGEPDITKWAVPPAPDIFTLETDHTNNLTPDPAIAFAIMTVTDEPTDPYQGIGPALPAMHLSSEVLHQICNLCTAQNDFERRLFEHRKRIKHEYDRAMKQIDAREIIGRVPKQEKDEALRQHRVELDRADRRAIEKMDELRYQQQIQLQSLGVPGFYPSSDVKTMQTQQAALLQAIAQLKPQQQ
ncbi:hypothetical protein LPJ66_006238 [Kickxella alabastrina]|uniref:Uncharacterized protein n=1 Tax=Kickxella alabastrina TaxID=61397 RepID=A0ACC1IDP5_9FUNG|nr:hypothetical protein LPJ66_006238 [Kickxella alabastrina]